MQSCACCACFNSKEKACLASLCVFLEHFKLCSSATTEFITTARELSDVLWKLSVRYNILLNSCPANIYPVNIVDQVICEIINEKRKILKKLKNAQESWIERYDILCNKYKSLRLAAQFVDYETGSRFLIDGCAHAKPLDYYLAAAGDAVYYYRSYQMLTKAKLIEITVDKAESVANFSKSLKVSDKFTIFLNELLLNSRFLVQNS